MVVIAGLVLPVVGQFAYTYKSWLSPDSSVSVSIVLKQKDDLLSLEALQTLGRIRTVLGRVVTMTTTVGSLQRLRAAYDVTSVSVSKLFEISLDTTVPEVGAPDVWSGLNDSSGQPVDGRGVIVGIIDTGIDPYHRDFYFDNGSCKILFIWDQQQGRASSGPHGLGVEFTRGEIEAGTASTNDTEGHGTHVSAIAASTGNAEGKYKGVAPGAWLIVVKAGGKLGIAPELWSFNDTDLIDGIAYVMEKAASLGMRAVINLSLGSDIGAHDGTSPTELALEEAARRGATIVVAAGNSADSNIHAEGSFTQGSTLELKWYVPDNVVAFDVDLWYELMNSVEVTLKLPSGATVSPPTGDLGLVTPAGAVTISPEQSEKGRGYLVEVLATGDSVSVGVYSLLIRATGVRSDSRWDAWVNDVPLGSRSSEFLSGPGYFITSAKTVSVPGTCDYVITVGAYICTGQMFATNGPMGSICSFSGRGPSRDGRTKPDLVAPGFSVTAALSSDASGLRGYAVDPTHVSLSGTSMATPHVSGVIALMLQWNPSLSPDSVKQLLRQSARLDSNTGRINKTTGDFTWGWGKLDARRAVSMIKVDITVSGVPYYLRLSIRVDGNERMTVTGPGSATLYLSGGISHRLSVPVVEQGLVRYSAPVSEYSVNSDSVLAFSFRTECYIKVETQFGNASGTGWYPIGSTVDPSVDPTEVQLGVGDRVVFTGWNVSTPIFVDGPVVIGAIWSEQVLLTIQTTVGTPIGGGWYVKGAKATISVNASVPVEGILGLLGVRYVLKELRTDNGTTVNPADLVMDSPMTLTLVYELDYSASVMYLAVLLFAVGVGAFILRVFISKSDEAVPPMPPPPLPLNDLPS